MSQVQGEWWESETGVMVVEDSVRTVRARQARLSVRRKKVSFKSMMLRTPGFDSRVRDFSSFDAWNTPEEGDPSSIGDWLSCGTTYEYDPDTGEVIATNKSVELGEDWDDVIPVDTEEGV